MNKKPILYSNFDQSIEEILVDSFHQNQSKEDIFEEDEEDEILIIEKEGEYDLDYQDESLTSILKSQF